MTLRFLVIAIILTAFIANPAAAQYPNLQVWTDTSMQESFYRCGAAGTTSEVLVVLSNADFVVSAVDFSINYPPSMIWLQDFPPTSDYIQHEWITIGNSPNGIAIAWANCCMMDGRKGPFIVMRAQVLWTGQCNGCYPIVVGGYAPLGKTQPSMIRNGDFREFPVLGMMTGYNPYFCDIAVQPTTWGSVKALYR